MKILKTLIYLVLLLPFQTYACNDDVTPRQMEIFKHTLRVDSTYDETLKNEFWQPWATCSLNEKQVISSRLFETVRHGVVGQKAKYQSALVSLKTGQFTYTHEYREYIKVSEKLNYEKGLPPSSIVREKAQTDELINAALTGKPISRNGLSLKIDENLINTVLAGLDQSVERMRALLTIH